MPVFNERAQKDSREAWTAIDDLEARGLLPRPESMGERLGYTQGAGGWNYANKKRGFLPAKKCHIIMELHAELRPETQSTQLVRPSQSIRQVSITRGWKIGQGPVWFTEIKGNHDLPHIAEHASFDDAISALIEEVQ